MTTPKHKLTLIVIFLLSISIAFAEPNPGHSASQVGPGTFSSGNYKFPNDVSWTGTLTGGSVPWARLTSFPTACSANQYVTGIGSALTCSPVAVDPNTVQKRVSGTCAAGSSIRVIDSNGGVTCQTDNTGSLTGGSANYVAKWSSPNSLTTSVIYDNGNVGIGTSPGNYKLQVGGDIMASPWFRINGGGGLYSESYGNYFYAPDSSYWRVKDNYGMLFYDGGWNVKGYIYYDSTGFGLLNNGGNWVLRNPSSTTDAMFYGNMRVNGANKEIRTDYDGSDNYYGSLRWAGLQFGNNGENRIVAGRTSAGGSLSFYVNNVNDAANYGVTPDGILAMRIASSGSVGIGTTSPGTAKLKISGGVLDMSSQKITNLATPTASTDAATKGYVDGKGHTIAWTGCEEFSLPEPTKDPAGGSETFGSVVCTAGKFIVAIYQKRKTDGDKDWVYYAKCCALSISHS